MRTRLESGFVKLRKLISSNYTAILFSFIAFLILFFSFFGNIFGVGFSQGWFTDFEKYSSLIIEKTARCKEEGFYGGPLVPSERDQPDYMQTMASDNCNKDSFTPYISQFGLQARVISFFAPTDNNQLADYFIKVQIVLAALSALIFTILVLYIRKLWGTKVAIIVLALLSISVWVVAYARNMYWVEFLIFLPFVFTFVGYKAFKEKKRLWLFFIILSLLFFVKLLNGYEHVSTLMISAFVAIAFHELYTYKDKSLKRLVVKGTSVFAIGVVALIASITINALGIMPQYGSFGESLHVVTGRAEDRSASGLVAMQPHVVSGFRATSPYIAEFVDRFYDLDKIADGHAHPLKYIIISLISYMALPAISIPLELREPLSSIVQSIGATLLFMGLILWLLGRTSLDKYLVRALRWSFGLALMGSLSWLILMPAHMYPHAHLNGIIFYLPTLIIGYIATALYVVMLFKDKKKKTKKRG